MDKNATNFLSLDYELVPIEKIIITADSNFSDYGFPGTGSANDPYIIENYNITKPYYAGIVIYETTKHFEIRNCYIDSDEGIILIRIQAQTAKISDNIINNSYSYYNCDAFGIRVYESDFVTITNNTFINSKSSIQIFESKSPVVHKNTCYITLSDKLQYASGISITACVSASVKFNNCTKVPLGYSITKCYSSVFSNNYALENSGTGVWIMASNNTIVNDNVFKSIGSYGILLRFNNYSSLNNNTCENTNYGMKLLYTSNSKIHFNMIRDNIDYGIYVDNCSNSNLITHNSFIKNKVGDKYSQAYDAGSDNVWYNSKTKEGNYWSDLGKNETYTIDGSADSIDIYPLNENLERTSFMLISMVLLLICFSFISIRRRKSS
ncbi:MAG: hypothetical protein HGN29_14940 [Asgard group archaeon]|nr:hypothetical protein [Asgard group archaeon]